MRIKRHQAESIVRDLAKGDAPLDGEFGYCTLGECESDDDAFDLDNHSASCPWRRAREWVKRHDQ